LREEYPVTVIDVVDVELHEPVNKYTCFKIKRNYAGCLFEFLDGFMDRGDVESLKRIKTIM